MPLKEKTRDVLETCIHYETIVNYQYREGDILTKHLISVYSTEIFDIANKDLAKTNQLKVIDLVIHEYLTDIKFNRYVKEHISHEDIDLDENSFASPDMLAILIKLYNKYRKRKENDLEQTIWL